MSEKKCKSCENKLVFSEKNDNISKCALCDGEYHNSCVGIGATVQKFIATKNCIWACDKCAEKGNVLSNVVKQLKSINSRLAGYEERFKKLELSSLPLSPRVSQLAGKRKPDYALAASGSWSEQVSSPSKVPRTESSLRNSEKIDNVLVLQSDNTTIRDQIESKVRECCNPIVDQIKLCKKTSTGKVVLKCNNSDALAKVRQKLSTKLGDAVKIDKPKTVSPMVKIVGVRDFVNNEELTQWIRKQNDDRVSENALFEIINVKKFNETATVIAKVDYETFKKLMSKKKILCYWTYCPVYEHVNVKRCFKCNKFGHVANDCESENECCPKCAGNHKVNDCRSDIVMCPNCFRVNAEKKLNLKTDHCAWSSECEVLQRRVNQMKKRTNYTK